MDAFHPVWDLVYGSFVRRQRGRAQWPTITGGFGVCGLVRRFEVWILHPRRNDGRPPHTSTLPCLPSGQLQRTRASKPQAWTSVVIRRRREPPPGDGAAFAHARRVSYHTQGYAGYNNAASDGSAGVHRDVMNGKNSTRSRDERELSEDGQRKATLSIFSLDGAKHYGLKLSGIKPAITKDAQLRQ